MGLRRADIRVHVAEVREASQALVIELRECRHETVAFAVVSALAFFRIRTITGTEPTSVVPVRASIVTSPLLTLGCPNLPTTKNGTDVPLIGTDSVTLLENAPVVPLRNPTAPPRRRYAREFHVDGGRGGAGWVGHANPAWRRAHETIGRRGLRCC